MDFLIGVTYVVMVLAILGLLTYGFVMIVGRDPIDWLFGSPWLTKITHLLYALSGVGCLIILIAMIRVSSYLQTIQTIQTIRSLS